MNGLNVKKLLPLKGVCLDIFNTCFDISLLANDLGVEYEELNESAVIFEKGENEEITFVRVWRNGSWEIWGEGDMLNGKPNIKAKVDKILLGADIWDGELMSFIHGLRSYLNGFVGTKNANIPSIIVEIEEIINE